MAASFCPQCAAPRQGAGRYCPSCAFDFWSAAAGSTPPASAVPPAQSNEWNAAAQKAEGPKRSWWGRRSLGAKLAIIVVAIIVVAAIAAPRNNDGSGTADATTTPRPTSPESEPTGDASPTAPPAPTATPGPAFADIPLSGTGDAVPRFTIPEGATAIAVITHTGASNFAVYSVAADGSNNNLLVNTIGNYSGTVLFDETSGTHSVAFDVTADGAWTITVKPLTAARIWDGATALSGQGDDVIHIDPAISGFATFTITHNGESNFAVFAYGPDSRDLLVNEIGAYSGESLFADGTFLLQITADGGWTVTPS